MTGGRPGGGVHLPPVRTGRRSAFGSADRVTYPTHADFMAAEDGLRSRSPEVDFGTWWPAEAGAGWPFARVSWLQVTGEVYAVTLGPEGSDFGPSVEVLGLVHNRELVERALDGWADHVGDGLPWVRAQLDGWPAQGPVARNRRSLAEAAWAERRRSWGPS